MTKVNLVGRKFGRLTVLSFAGILNKTHTTWNCICDCGTQKVVRGPNLVKGLTKSCGCISKEITAKRNLTHGLSHKSAAYKSWENMRRRCLCPSHTQYHNYGGRGITICERWNDFENFLADMGERPPGLSLERINNDGNYELSNCKWATQKEQCNNQRKRKLDKNDRALIKDLRIIGCDGATVARQFNVSRNHIYHIWR